MPDATPAYRCALCHEPGATAQLHVQTNVGTFLLLGSFAHPLCIVNARQTEAVNSHARLQSDLDALAAALERSTVALTNLQAMTTNRKWASAVSEIITSARAVLARVRPEPTRPSGGSRER